MSVLKRVAPLCALLSVLYIFPSLLWTQQPVVNAGGVVNGASFAAGAPVAPGSIASVFGSNLGSSPSGVRVRMNGIDAPLFAVSPQQINFQVPWELSGQSEASLTVTVGGATSSPARVALADFAAGVFVANSSGQGAILIANTATVVAAPGVFPGSRRVVPGEFISIYCTGLGPVTNQPETGVFAPYDPPSTSIATPTVTIGGVPAPVVFSGLAPGFIGLYQVNVQVPSEAPLGDAVPVVVNISGSASNTVTIGVEPLGPQGGGPAGALIAGIVIDPNNSATIYAASLGAGVLKSTNGGTSWTPVNTGLTFPVVFSVVIDPTAPTTLYAGTDDGVFKSINGGANWTAANAGLTDTEVFPLAIDPTTPSTLYAGTNESGVFKSTNGGTSWTAASTGLPLRTPTPPRLAPVNALAIAPTNSSILYAGTDGDGVFKSINGGASWTAVNTGLTNLFVFRFAVHPTTPSTLYAATFGGVFKSSDAGATWAPVNIGLTNLFVFGLAIDPTAPTRLYAGTFADIFKTTDSGASWTALNLGLKAAGVEGLAMDPITPSTLYASPIGGGVFKTTNGGANWAPANTNLAFPLVKALAVNPATPTTLYAATDGAGVFKSTNAGGSWSAINTGLPATGLLTVFSLAVDPVTTSTLYAGVGAATKVVKSTDGGANWSPANRGLPSAIEVNSLVIDPSNPATVYAGLTSGTGAVFKTTDGGANWTAANTGIPTGVTIESLVIDPLAPATLYAATPGNGVFKTITGGTSWTASSTGLPLADPNQPRLRVISIKALVIDPRTPAIVYVGTARAGVFKSTDGGGSWRAANAGLLASVPIASLAIDPVTTTTVYAGTEGAGVFKSTDGAATWQPTGR